MFMKTVVKVVYSFLLQNLVEDSNRLLPDGVADSARCGSLCSRYVDQHYLHAKKSEVIKKEQWPLTI